MAPETEPLIFVCRSNTVDITNFKTLKTIGNMKGIEWEHFTLRGYDWAIEIYPQGINKSDSNYLAIFVKLLNANKPVEGKYSFSMWNWSTSNWSTASSNLVTFLPSDGKVRWGYDRYSLNELIETSIYLKNDTFRIMYTILVTPRLQAPDIDKPAGTSNQRNPSGSKISFGNGFHTASYAPPNASPNAYTDLPRQPTVRIYCEANKDLSVTIRNGTVVLALADSNDYYQHWIKDMTYGDKVKDEDGFPAFALVNRVTGQALQNRAVENKEVTLVPYNPNRLEDSVKWSVRTTGFRAIRIADKVWIVLTAVGSDNNTIFTDGGKIVVKKWFNSPVQRWKIVPYNSNVPY